MKAPVGYITPKQKRAPSGLRSLRVPDVIRADIGRIEESDEQTARVCFLFGYMPHLPPIPPSLGAGVELPNHGRNFGIR
jgi:hypothetical protein